MDLSKHSVNTNPGSFNPVLYAKSHNLRIDQVLTHAQQKLGGNCTVEDLAAYSSTTVDGRQITLAEYQSLKQQAMAFHQTHPGGSSANPTAIITRLIEHKKKEVLNRAQMLEQQLQESQEELEAIKIQVVNNPGSGDFSESERAALLQQLADLKIQLNLQGSNPALKEVCEFLTPLKNTAIVDADGHYNLGIFDQNLIDINALYGATLASFEGIKNDIQTLLNNEGNIDQEVNAFQGVTAIIKHKSKAALKRILEIASGHDLSINNLDSSFNDMLKLFTGKPMPVIIADLNDIITGSNGRVHHFVAIKDAVCTAIEAKAYVDGQLEIRASFDNNSNTIMSGYEDVKNSLLIFFDDVIQVVQANRPLWGNDEIVLKSEAYKRFDGAYNEIIKLKEMLENADLIAFNKYLRSTTTDSQHNVKSRMDIVREGFAFLLPKTICGQAAQYSGFNSPTAVAYLDSLLNGQNTGAQVNYKTHAGGNTLFEAKRPDGTNITENLGLNTFFDQLAAVPHGKLVIYSNLKKQAIDHFAQAMNDIINSPTFLLELGGKNKQLKIQDTINTNLSNYIESTSDALELLTIDDNLRLEVEELLFWIKTDLDENKGVAIGLSDNTKELFYKMFYAYDSIRIITTLLDNANTKKPEFHTA